MQVKQKFKKAYVALLLLGVMLTACVTINVYFPEAEVQEAAGAFIEGVIGVDPSKAAAPQKPDQGAGLFRVDFALISSAQAAADLSVETPAIKAIQQRMAERFSASLVSLFDRGVLGLSNDGLIEIRDASSLKLAERATAKQWVADDNRDRAAVYRELALANGHAEWEAEIRATFSRQWIEKARPGWYYQNAQGAWLQK